MDNKWKQYSNYEEIKNKYLEHDLTQHEIVNSLIYHKEKYNYNYNELNSLEIISFKNKNDFKSLLEKDSLVIINSIFGHSFPNILLHSNFTKYSLNYNKINIILNNETLTFISNNNILSYKNAINFNHKLNDNKNNLTIKLI